MLLSGQDAPRPSASGESAPADPAAETVDSAWTCALPEGMRRFPDGKGASLPVTFAKDPSQYPLGAEWIRVLSPIDAPCRMRRMPSATAPC
jgi:hypothetical protein